MNRFHKFNTRLLDLAEWKPWNLFVVIVIGWIFEQAISGILEKLIWGRTFVNVVDLLITCLLAIYYAVLCNQIVEGE